MTPSPHKTVHDYIPVAKSMNSDAFTQRYNHPFLFGREVLEEEFRFSTLVTDESSVDVPKALQAARDAGLGAMPTTNVNPAAGPASTDVFRIRHWVIVVRKPLNAPVQDRIFLGRSETNDICVPHKTVSKLHAYFQRDASTAGVIATKWQLVDTGSANGTKHNGMRIPPRAKATILDGDTVCFGRCVFQWMTARSLYDRLVAMGNAGVSPG